MIHKRHLAAAMQQLADTWDGESVESQGVCNDCMASFILSIQHSNREAAAEMVGGILCGIAAQKIAEADDT